MNSQRPATWLLLSLAHGRLSLRLDRRAVWVGTLLALGCLLLAGLALQLGRLPLNSGQVVRALLGSGSAQEIMVIQQWRLPRVLLALVAGAALGMSGAIFQSLVRNPLGSPDLMGFNSGAYSGALLVIVLAQGSYWQIAGGAMAGGLACAVLVYLLAWRRGIQGFRLIIVGIAVSAMLGALNTWLSLLASLEAALSAALWGAGSLNGMTWAKGLPAGLCCLLLMTLALPGSRALQLLEMGDDSASALGVNVERTRLLLMAIGVLLSAATTAACGPIAFIALAAPQLARRLCRSRASPLLCAAWLGAALLLSADLLAQHVFAPRQLPVGVITVSIGGFYLIWLLLQPSPRVSA